MGTAAPLKTATNPLPPFYLMTADLAAALLNRASNGAELLQVLETLAAEQSADPEPTADPVQF